MNIKVKHKRKALLSILSIIFIVSIISIFFSVPVEASQTTDTDDVSITSDSEPFGFNFNLSTNGESSGLSSTLQMVLILTVISIAPSILLMITSFTRIVVVLHFVRSAIGTQTTPPNQILIGLALFLTVFIMGPVFTQVNNEALQPYSKGEITQEQAIERGLEPIRHFMFGQTRPADIKLFMEIARLDYDGSQVTDQLEASIPTSVLIPSFMISELRKAFIIGFIIYIPFIIIDMVVASTLMSMGMMMLPPTTISMPFKILLFILVDGWNLVIGTVVKTFYTS
ncbi:MAG TPA: flagellar type III secretion system pore protein FliP [Lachnospiraceae bacterium]|nr:flagellar type III secretion system pore protein FliP [Lachnospiraceae bacterium]